MSSADADRALRRCGVAPPASSGRSDRIGELYVMLTWRCNLRCRMCPMWGDRGFCLEQGPGDETLTPEAVTEFVESAASLRPRTVTISGGEPLLSEHCLPLARRLAERGLKVMLTTNATLLADLAPADLAVFRQINVSLDGPPLVLERMKRGGSATMDRALAGLAAVRRLAGHQPALQLLTVITAEGAGHLGELLALFDREGISFDRYLFQHQMFLTPEAAAGQRAALEGLLGPGVDLWGGMVSVGGGVDVATLLGELHRIRRRFPAAVFSPTLEDAEVRRYYADGSWLPPRFRRFCPSPWLDVGITPSGDVWLCPGHAVGNVHRQTLDEVFNGPRARRLRQAIVADGLMPGCRGCFYLYNYQQAPP